MSDQLTFRRTNTFIYHSIESSLYHISLSFSRRLCSPFPDLTYSCPSSFPHSSFSFFHTHFIFFLPLCFGGGLANRHHWQQEPIQCQEGLCYVCLSIRMRVCAWFWGVDSVELMQGYMEKILAYLPPSFIQLLVIQQALKESDREKAQREWR